MGNNIKLQESKPQVHVLCNCYWGDGMSGGDRRLIEIIRRWKGRDEFIFILYTTKSFARIVKSEGINHIKFVFTDKNCNEKTLS